MRDNWAKPEVEYPSFKVITVGGEGEVTEKRSRFLGLAVPVDSEAAVQAILEERRKKYWDASHHVYAYVLGTRGETVRCSDDGEPSGTGGRPVLDVLQGMGIHNGLVVVTRYFGGTLLGTGGLSRAYGAGAQAALESSRQGTMVYGFETLIRTDYHNLGRIQYILRQKGKEPIGLTYGEKVEITLEIAREEVDELRKVLTDAVGGNLQWDQGKGKYILWKEENLHKG